MIDAIAKLVQPFRLAVCPYPLDQLPWQLFKRVVGELMYVVELAARDCQSLYRRVLLTSSQDDLMIPVKAINNARHSSSEKASQPVDGCTLSDGGARISDDMHPQYWTIVEKTCGRCGREIRLGRASEF